MQIKKRSTSACQQCSYLLDSIMGEFHFLLFVQFEPLNFLSWVCIFFFFFFASENKSFLQSNKALKYTIRKRKAKKIKSNKALG